MMTEWEKAEAGLLYMLSADERCVEGQKKSQALN